jgi:AcrR family transcriptional regulator
MGRRQVDEVTDARRDQMLRAAVDVICERGYSDARISDVAKISGVSPALVIYYFKTKAGLLTEALRYAEDLYYGAVEKELSALEGARPRLEYLVRASCVERIEGERPNAWGLWLDLWAQALRNPELGRVRAQVDRRWAETITGVVQDGVDSGEFAAVDVDQFAMVFAALLDGLSIQVALHDDLVTQDRAVAGALGYAQGVLQY